MAGLVTFSSCMALADLSADGEHKLIVADLGNASNTMKLKVYLYVVTVIWIIIVVIDKLINIVLQ